MNSHYLGRDHIKVYVDQYGILNIEEQRRMTKASVAMMRARFEEILAAGQSPKLGLVDLTGVELATVIPLRAKVAEAATLIDPKKVAVIADSRLLWVMVSFVMNLSGTKDATKSVRIFHTKADAEKWLLEDG